MKYTLSFLAAALLLTSVSFLSAEETIEVSEFTFRYDKPWLRQQTSSPMRAGQFLYEFEDKNQAGVELVLFFFGPTGGGGVQANIDRWMTQFVGSPESKIEEKEFKGRKVIFVTLKGTYQDTMGAARFSGPQEPKENYTMLAAILTSEKGDVFLKFVGPNASIDAAKADFFKFVTSPFAQ